MELTDIAQKENKNLDNTSSKPKKRVKKDKK